MVNGSSAFVCSSSDLPLLSYIGSFRFLINSTNMINLGVKKVTLFKPYAVFLTSKFSGQVHRAMFKVPDLFKWIVIVTGMEQMEDLYKAPDKVLSSRVSVEEASTIISCGDHCSRTNHV